MKKNLDTRELYIITFFIAVFVLIFIIGTAFQSSNTDENST